VIRPATSEDTAAIAGLAVATGMFAPEDAGFVTAMMDAYFAGADAEGHACVVDDDGEGPVAVAYFQPEAAADRVWDLTMIAVRPDLQGTGRGIALLAHVETAVRDDGARLLLIETSGTAQYDDTRAFYVRRGYDEEARVRDYWTDGDDLVVFRKALADTPATV
jgi:GNAT superfamily N-acetyltransferase